MIIMKLYGEMRYVCDIQCFVDLNCISRQYSAYSITNSAILSNAQSFKQHSMHNQRKMHLYGNNYAWLLPK